MRRRPRARRRTWHPFEDENEHDDEDDFLAIEEKATIRNAH